MIVRDETPGDHEAVRAVVSAAFGQDGEAGLVSALHQAGDAIIALAAEEDGRVVGHVLLSRMAAPFPALALAPVSVAPDRQGLGIGSALVRAALERARSEGWVGVFVLGDPGYYTRFGFSIAAAAGFSSPYAGPHFMLLALTEPLPASEGELRHAPAFGALD